MNKSMKICDAKKIELNNATSRKILAYGKDLMAVEVSFEQGAKGDAHSHPHAQISYILEGKFVFETNDKTYHVEKGDSIYFAPHEVHGGTCIEKGKVLDVFTPLREDFIKE